MSLNTARALYTDMGKITGFAVNSSANPMFIKRFNEDLASAQAEYPDSATLKGIEPATDQTLLCVLVVMTGQLVAALEDVTPKKRMRSLGSTMI